MSSSITNLETLRNILENSHQPQLFDSHPWTRSLIVRQASADAPELLDKAPGQRLVLVISKLFAQMMPTTAPRRGKRLDTRWGEFGILAAQYFAPLTYGKPVPTSLRDAWGHIDEGILLFVYGKPGKNLSEAEKEPYILAGTELDIAPNSTLSDWHRKGLERLAEMIIRRESYLAETMLKPAVILPDGSSAENAIRKPKPFIAGKGRFIFLFLGILLLGLLLFGAIKGWRIYKQAALLRQDAVQIRSLISAPGSKLERVKSVGPALFTLKHDFDTLKNEVGPFLWLAPMASWIPVYGGDLASVQNLVNMADALLASTDISYKIAQPLLAGNNTSGFSPTKLTEMLIQAQPQLIEADRQLVLAKTFRSRLSIESLTPDLHDLIIKYVDPLMAFMGDGLSVAVDLPRLLGATAEGPKSYLVLVQNEDELRPTGGFITAVGTVLVDNGRIGGLTFDDSGNLDNWAKPYPAAPWQLRQYMDSGVLVLRDSNWFTNYPTAALYAETLYSYANAHTVDGTIAFDQQLLVKILVVTGPIKLEGVDVPIDSNNIIAYMRSAKTPTAEELASHITVTKTIFMKKLVDALMVKLFSGDIQPEYLITALFQALNEHHLLLKIDSPSITAVLARQRWDGAIRPQTGDFLMVVDTNIGFNKTNAVVQSNLTYDIDLTKPGSPIGTLTVFHQNNATPIICKQNDKIRLPGEEFYPITDCYWNYLRVYMTVGTELLDATPQFVPANWMLIKQDVPARVDTLDEKIDGVQAFGTLQVIPGGESLVTSFRFALPATIIQTEAGQSKYHLFVQKQPGTLAVPIIIRLQLPNNATIKTAPAGAVVQGKSILYQTDLRTDIEFEIVFQIP